MTLVERVVKTYLKLADSSAPGKKPEVGPFQDALDALSKLDGHENNFVTGELSRSKLVEYRKACRVLDTLLKQLIEAGQQRK